MSKKRRARERKRWTLGEKERLLDLHRKGLGLVEIAKILQRTEASVKAQFERYDYL